MPTFFKTGFLLKFQCLLLFWLRSGRNPEFDILRMKLNGYALARLETAQTNPTNSAFHFNSLCI